MANVDTLSDIPDPRNGQRAGDLRIAIVGGGVAGLTAAAALHVRGLPCRVYERRRPGAAAGMGIVLAAGARADLTGAGLDLAGAAEPDPAGAAGRPGASRAGSAGAPRPLGSLGVELHRFRSYHPDGTLRQVQDIPAGWRGLPRGELVDALGDRLPAGTVQPGAELAELRLDPDGTVREARLGTGEPVPADLYVAADGAHSLARRTWYAHWPQPPARVRELVGIAHCPPASDWAYHDLCKFQAPGLSIGILPIGGGSVGWFMQFDSQRFAPPPDTAAGRRAFAHRLVGGWPDPVPALLRATDHSQTHVWHPIDADLVPRFHSGNLVLLGDAAHPLLPFTSQGVGAAISGARDLAAELDRPTPVVAALARYAAASRDRCAPFVARGRELTQAFLAAGGEAVGVLPLAVPSTAGGRR